MFKAKYSEAEKIARRLSWQQRAAMRSIAAGRTSRMSNKTDDSLHQRGLITSSTDEIERPALTDLGKEIFAAMRLP